MSGLNQRFTKPSNLNRFREFESHRLRKGFREAKSFAEARKCPAALSCEIRTAESYFLTKENR